MIGLCCKKTYGSMKNCDDRYDEGDNDRDNDIIKDKNDNDYVAPGSRYNGPIFHPMVTPWSCLGLVEEDRGATKMALRPQRHVYLTFEIYLPYKYPINAILYG